MNEQQCNTGRNCQSCQGCADYSHRRKPGEKETDRSELKKLIIIVLLVVIAMSFNAWQKNRDFVSQITPLIPAAEEFEQISSDPLVYKATKDDRVLGYCGVGSGVGYGGNISIVAAVDQEGKVLGVKVLNQTETPSFFNKVVKADYFKQYQGKDIKKDAFALGDDIDAVSGATVSSTGAFNAVVNGIQAIAAQQSEITGDRDWSQREVSQGLSSEDYYSLVALMILLAVVVYAAKTKKTKLRWFTMIAGIMVLGIWQERMVSLALMGSFLMNPIGSFKINFFGSVLVVSVLVFCLLIRKNLYCTWICPFGAAQEIIFKASGSKNPRIDKNLREKIGRFSRILAAAALITGIAAGNPGLTSFEPFPTLFGFNGGAMQWLLLALILIGAFFIERFWCRFFCPVGIINTWMLKWGLRIPKISREHKTAKEGAVLDGGDK